MGTTTLWLTALGIVLGFITAYAGLHGAGDVLVYVLLLLFGGLLGYLEPRAPWRWALVLGVWVPIAEIVYRLTYPFGQPHFKDIVAPLLALVPPLLGVYAGAYVRRSVSPPSRTA